MRPLSLTAAAALTAALSLVAGAAVAAAPVTLDPKKLPRGADPAIAYIDGSTLVDGSVRVPIDADRVVLLGESGTGYVVVTANEQGGKGRLYRVEANGTTTALGKGDPYASILSSDGKTVVTPRSRIKDGGTTKMKVRDAVTGQKIASMKFDGYPSPLDAKGTSVLVSGFERQGTQVWNTATGTVTKLTKRIGTHADYANDLFASFTKDPYRGGCTVVARISNPSAQLYKSCDEAVYAFSTDGSHLATVDILTDGIGPGAVRVRTATGTLVAEYQAPRIGYFGLIEFEDADTLLLQTNGRRKAALVRCTVTTCDRASDLSRSEQPRQAA